MFNFMCSAPAGAVPQFELQVPKIMRHKYVEDQRNYTLVSFYTENQSFEESNCIQTEETKHFIIFRGALEGQNDCKINHWMEYENESLFDMYSATVGYDDLIGNLLINVLKFGLFPFFLKNYLLVMEKLAFVRLSIFFKFQPIE